MNHLQHIISNELDSLDRVRVATEDHRTRIASLKLKVAGLLVYESGTKVSLSDLESRARSGNWRGFVDEYERVLKSLV